MNRRGFFGWLGGVAATAVAGPAMLKAGDALLADQARIKAEADAEVARIDAEIAKEPPAPTPLGDDRAGLRPVSGVTWAARPTSVDSYTAFV